MEKIKITPHPLNGEVVVPPSKSAAHRNIIAAALSDGVSVISPACHSDDIDATLRCITALGATVTEKDGAFYITGIDKNKACGKTTTLDCGESGSTLRFMIPIAAALGVNATFIGHGQLPNRPITPLIEILTNFGVKCSSDRLPLTISGCLQKGDYLISGDISSQYLTGLIFACPITGGTATLTTPLQSAGYVDLTVKILSNFGVNIIKNGATYISNGNYTPSNQTIEGDWSQACFFMSAAAMGGSIKIKGLDLNSTQGDKAVLDIYKALGATVDIKDNCICVSSGSLTATDINCAQIPDAVPALAVASAVSKGNTTIFGGERLRFKETDRIKTVTHGLKNMGIAVTEQPDGMVITGGSPLGGIVSGESDHRIVMAFAILAAYSKNDTIIEGYTAINKSYPTFFEDFKALGGIANVITDR